jgi:hypothetical protein
LSLETWKILGHGRASSCRPRQLLLAVGLLPLASRPGCRQARWCAAWQGRQAAGARPGRRQAAGARPARHARPAGAGLAGARPLARMAWGAPGHAAASCASPRPAGQFGQQGRGLAWARHGPRLARLREYVGPRLARPRVVFDLV